MAAYSTVCILTSVISCLILSFTTIGHIVMIKELHLMANLYIHSLIRTSSVPYYIVYAIVDILHLLIVNP